MREHFAMRPTLLQVTNGERGILVCDRARLADAFLSRLVGLLGLKNLEGGDGLWITPSSGVHTWGMRFPIDIVALDRNLRVVDVAPEIGPWRIAGLGWSTRSVLELPAGQIARSVISIGDRLSISRVEKCNAKAHARATRVDFHLSAVHEYSSS
jgi:uncharacterized membrane protein (UPF0127 family)